MMHCAISMASGFVSSPLSTTETDSVRLKLPSSGSTKSIGRPSSLSATARHLHGKRIRIVSLIHHGNRLCQAEVAFLRIYKINRKTVFFIRNRLLPESEADGNLAGAHFLERSGSGILQVVSHILIDACQHFLRAVLAVCGHKRLDQQPRCGGGGDIRSEEHT